MPRLLLWSGDRAIRSGWSLNQGGLEHDGRLANLQLDREGHPIEGVSLDWLAMAVFVAYVIALETRTGATLGGRVAWIRVLDAAAPDAAGVPLRKVIIRYLTMFTGVAPMLVILLFCLALYGGDIEAIFAGNAPKWIALAAIPAFACAVVILVQIASKRDPLYDKSPELRSSVCGRLRCRTRLLDRGSLRLLEMASRAVTSGPHSDDREDPPCYDL
jgi:hypothetical protein